MKKVILSSLTVLSIVIVTSCSGGTKSIDDLKIEDIKTACDCVDAMVVVMDDVLTTIEGKTEEQIEADETALAKVEKAEKVFGDIENQCRNNLNLNKTDLEVCPNFNDFESKMSKIEAVL